MPLTEVDPYAGYDLRTRLELLAFEARHASFPESLIRAVWEALAVLPDSAAGGTIAGTVQAVEEASEAPPGVPSESPADPEAG